MALTFPLPLPAHVAAHAAATALLAAEAARNARRPRTQEEADLVSMEARRRISRRLQELTTVSDSRNVEIEDLQKALLAESSGDTQPLLDWRNARRRARDPWGEEGGEGEDVGWAGAEEDWAGVPYSTPEPTPEDRLRRRQATEAYWNTIREEAEAERKRLTAEAVELLALRRYGEDGGAKDAYWKEGREEAAALEAAVVAAEAILPTHQLRVDMRAWRVVAELLLLEQERGGDIAPRVRLTGAESAEANWPTVEAAVEAAIAGPGRQMGGVWLWVQTWAAQDRGGGPIAAAEAAVRLRQR